MSENDPTRFERLQYYQGQTLLAADLSDQDADLARLGWSHNLALHRAFGVSFGLSVTVEGGSAKVDCGLAYDCRGRALVLSAARSIELPNGNDASVWLVLSYRPTHSERAPVEANSKLRWISQACYRIQDGVPLARFVLRDGYSRPVDSEGRPLFRAPMARADSRPQMAARIIQTGNISWEELPGDAGLQVRVDTSAAGFTSNDTRYMASLVWRDQNKLFSPPFVSIVDPSPEGFTLRLLLRGLGEEAFLLVRGAGLVSKPDFADLNVSFSRTVLFESGQDFQAGDAVARLDPRANRLLPLSAASDTKLELSDTQGEAPFAINDLAVAANLPRSMTVESSTQAFRVGLSGTALAALPGDVVVRAGASEAGSAARVVASRANDLWLSNDTGLSKGDALALFGEQSKIDAISDTGALTLSDALDIDKGTLVVRVANAKGQPVDLSGETPSSVSSIKGKKITLKPKLALEVGDTLAFAREQRDIVSFDAGATLTYEVDGADLVLPGDVVRVRGASSSAVVLGSTDTFLTVDGELAAEQDDILDIADYPRRSTINSVGVYNDVNYVFLGAPIFESGDLAVRLGSDENQLCTVIFAFGSLCLLDRKVDGLAAGQVLALPRFARTATINNVSDETTLTVDDATKFAPLDLVTRTPVDASSALAVVDKVEGQTLHLRTGLPGLAAGQQLAVVSLRAVSQVTDVSATSLTLAPNADFRPGDYAGVFSGWLDASKPAALDDGTLSQWLDGLLPHDAVGMAALSETQTTLRFDTTVRVTAGEQLRIAGKSAQSGEFKSFSAGVVKVESGRATLSYGAPSPFQLRPEDLQVTEAFTKRLPGRFAAYAQQQGVTIAWLGHQPSLASSADCPLTAPAPCACCDDEVASQGTSDCCK